MDYNAQFSAMFGNDDDGWFTIPTSKLSYVWVDPMWGRTLDKREEVEWLLNRSTINDEGLVVGASSRNPQVGGLREMTYPY